MKSLLIFSNFIIKKGGFQMYQANIYEDSVIIKRIVANGIDTLKTKCRHYILAQNITTIEVLKLEDVGYLKLPKEIENIIEKDLML